MILIFRSWLLQSICKTHHSTYNHHTHTKKSIIFFWLSSLAETNDWAVIVVEWIDEQIPRSSIQYFSSNPVRRMINNNKYCNIRVERRIWHMQLDLNLPTILRGFDHHFNVLCWFLCCWFVDCFFKLCWFGCVCEINWWQGTILYSIFFELRTTESPKIIIDNTSCWSRSIDRGLLFVNGLLYYWQAKQSTLEIGELCCSTSRSWRQLVILKINFIFFHSFIVYLFRAGGIIHHRDCSRWVRSLSSHTTSG